MTHDKKHVIRVNCPFCGQKTYVHLNAEEWEKYERYFIIMERSERPAIQTIFPDMPAEDRDLLISGMCKDCQKETFGA